MWFRQTQFLIPTLSKESLESHLQTWAFIDRKNNVEYKIDPSKHNQNLLLPPQAWYPRC
jgi:hypothetical protein